MRCLTIKLHYSLVDETTVEEIEKLAIELLGQTWKIDIYMNKPAQELNLAELGWTFEFNTRKRSAGLCSLRDKKISISSWLLSQNLNKASEFENTIRHEIAHAIEYEMTGTSGHGARWKAIARQVLCTAERCYTSEQIAVKAKTKYTLKCSSDDCDFERPSHKARPKKARSVPCCNSCYDKGRGLVRLVQIQNF